MSKSVCMLVADALLSAVLCSGATAGPITLTDVTQHTGINFVHTDGSHGRYYIMETVCAGLALFDYDGDGHIDLYFLNGAPLPGASGQIRPANALYRNNGDWTFTDVTAKAGVGDTGFALGVAVGDYNNDGALDLYLNNYGPNVLYCNNGNGSFTDTTQTAGVANQAKVGAGACFLDMDKDGDLDLYVSNYLDFAYDKHVARSQMGFPVYASPRCYPPLPDNLFRNNGDGTFTDVSKTAGIAIHAGWGMGMICADYDSDGDTDVLVANDVAENFLFANNGAGRFEEVALFSGFAYDGFGDEQGSMGVDCGDYNNDGRPDFFMTSYQGQLAVLYKNLGEGLFQDVSTLTGAGANTLARVTWGNGLVDFDNDGDRDIFIACGHLQDRVESYDPAATYAQRNILLLHAGNERFRDISAQAGSGLAVKLSSRGAGFDDLDNDGDVDVVVLNSRGAPTLLRNDSHNSHHWIQVNLQGKKTNRYGVGARVKVTAGDLVQCAEVHSGRGYQSHYGMRLHFGLGLRNRIDAIEVRWMGGSVDVFKNITVNQIVVLREGDC